MARDLKPLPLQRRKQLIQAVLGVAEEHHAFFIVIQLIIHSGEARPHTTFEDHNRFGPVHLQDGHAVKRTVAVVLGGLMFGFLLWHVNEIRYKQALEDEASDQ